jgi:tryptophan synthase beta chain
MTVMAEPKLGRFGDFGGRYVPESLVPACAAVEESFRSAWADPSFRGHLDE